MVMVHLQCIIKKACLTILVTLSLEPATQAKGKIQSQKLCLPNHCQGDNVQLLFQERLRKQLKLLAITNREMMKQTEHGIDWEHQTCSV